MVRLPAAVRAAGAPVILATAASLVLGGWWQSGKPVDLPAAGRMPLQCVSYAPSASSEAPQGPVTREHIRRDLARLAGQFRCVRTYSVSHGLDQVPSVARQLGLRVLLGVWISGDQATNEREIAKAIATAQRDREAIDAIVVGNEVLLRHELPASDLAPLIERVGRDTGIPVTYADVWGRWIANRGLAQSVDFVTVHILPYWDDDPVAAAAVIPYVERLYDNLQALFPGKRLLVGETGWPSEGKPRGDLEPGRINQARYLREFTALAERRGIPYNIIEAFDQPWKRAHEGTVGGYWGLYDAEGREKFSWSGPVTESTQARAIVGGSLILGALGACSGLLFGGTRRVRSSVMLASGAVLAAGIAAHQFAFLRTANVSWPDWAGTLLIAAAGWVAFAIAIRGALAASFRHDSMPRPVVLLLLAGCAYCCVGLVLAGRHRDLPFWLFLPAVIGLVLAAWLDPAGRARTLVERRATEETVLATWLVLAGALIPVIEGVKSGLPVGWGLSAAALGLCVLLPLALQSREHQRAAEHAHD